MGWGVEESWWWKAFLAVVCWTTPPEAGASAGTPGQWKSLDAKEDPGKLLCLGRRRESRWQGWLEDAVKALHHTVALKIVRWNEMMIDAQWRGQVSPECRGESGAPIWGKVAGDPESEHPLMQEGVSTWIPHGGYMVDSSWLPGEPLDDSKDVSETMWVGEGTNQVNADMTKRLIEHWWLPSNYNSWSDLWLVTPASSPWTGHPTYL